VQWQAAGLKPAALKALALTFRETGNGLAFRGGAYELGLVRSSALTMGVPWPRAATA
jgi:predicted acyl esterase